uniref:Major facilitator superfamily (MFS) profile domain-containing protein n=1 Tax=Kwoniella bestiolae CBS 10118 TaxID=1296100 RepID=A0A1B9FUX0_9TREE|nr:hypothetical protein I302_08212 [Kwoniella bestiolae CBS 10118]OCF22562.1 hypothetical protein I302_08212 [Kwoniella bestiolae CBS 10118]
MTPSEHIAPSVDVNGTTSRAPSRSGKSGPFRDNESKARWSLLKGSHGSSQPLLGVKWRSSSWFITIVVTLGVATDLLAYAIVVPILPYRLQSLHYTNVSSLTSWLLFAYSMGIFLCTFPVGYFFHKYPLRRAPLIAAVLALDLAVILFMTINTYWVMVVSRFIQGASSTVVLSVGFALLTENVPEENIGRQMGFAFSGISIGMTIAPPIGGALYKHMGWHAPFIFCIIALTFDLVLRLLVVEQKDLRRWEAKQEQKRLANTQSQSPANVSVNTEPVENNVVTPEAAVEKQEEKEVVELSPWKVIVTICSSGRGMTGFWLTFMYGLIIGMLEPTLTLRVQAIWHKESDFVGLIYLAAAAPTFITGPIIGTLADKFGAEYIMLPCLIIALPWLPLMMLKDSLAGFIVFFALSEVALQCASSPTGLEITLVARKTPGISEIHQFAALNVAFAISSSIGAVVGGQMYDHISPSGWAAICWFALGMIAMSLPLPFLFSGNKSIYRRLIDRGKGAEDGGGTSESQPQVD